MEKELFDLMTKMYAEMQEMRKDISTINAKLDQKVDKVDIVALEYNISEKLDALFDAREVGIDRDTEISQGLSRVENKVDKLELRVLRQHFGKKIQ